MNVRLNRIIHFFGEKTTNFLRGGGDKIREGTRRESVSFLCAGYWMRGDLYDLQVMFLVLNNCASHSRYFRKKVIPASAVRCHRK